MKKYFLLTLLLLMTPYFAFSQTRVEEQVSIELSPQHPGPNELVIVSIESFQIDLNKSEINWLVNGTLQESGFGLKTFSFTTGSLGEETNLSVRIVKQNGEITTKNISVNPGGVDLYYEPQTYTPPFYKGKPEFTFQSDLKIIALPNFVDQNGNKIPSGNIVYNWKIDGSADQINSGVGRDVYNYQSGILSGPVQVVLEASPINSNQSARVVETVRPTEPTILIYEKNPIYGTIFEQNIKNDFIVNREEIELVAIPYNFSQDIIRNGTFKWLLNGERVNNFISNNIIFRKTDDRESSNNITIEIEHKNKVLQIKRYSFPLNFGGGNNEFNF
ncbi:hypothetical protein GW764_00755 [Candidatus Parcubacteria bacterium]|nr:hypothetical protein [Candidatus Parcubacteria bacterium]